MTTFDPLALLQADRAKAQGDGDPMANLCVLATIADGEPEARTLVLRDVESRLGVFFNRTSPKFSQLDQSTTVAVVVYLPSIAVQYRLRSRLAPIPADIVATSWQLRPPVPKRMDWLYERQPQGSIVPSRQHLVDLLDATAPDTAPASAIGYYLVPEVVERLDLRQDNGIHDRRLYAIESGTWTTRVRVP